MTAAERRAKLLVEEVFAKYPGLHVSVRQCGFGLEAIGWAFAGGQLLQCHEILTAYRLLGRDDEVAPYVRGVAVEMADGLAKRRAELARVR
jgi:hypothetical protein